MHVGALHVPHQVANDVLAVRIGFRQLLDGQVGRAAETVSTRLLLPGPVALLHEGKSDLAHLVGEFGIRLGRIVGPPLRRADHLAELLDLLDDRLDVFVAEQDRVSQVVFRDLVGAAFQRHNVIRRAGHNEIQVAVIQVAVGRVDDEFAFDPSHADGGERRLHGNVRDMQGRGGADDAQDVVVVLHVRRQHDDGDLRLVEVILGEKGTDGVIDLPPAQDLFLGRWPFSPEPRAGNASRRVHPLAVIHHQRKVVAPFHVFAFRNDVGQNHTLAILHPYG